MDDESARQQRVSKDFLPEIQLNQIEREVLHAEDPLHPFVTIRK
jgi:hypothetical protein